MVSYGYGPYGGSFIGPYGGSFIRLPEARPTQRRTACLSRLEVEIFGGSIDIQLPIFAEQFQSHSVGFPCFLREAPSS